MINDYKIRRKKAIIILALYFLLIREWENNSQHTYQDYIEFNPNYKYCHSDYYAKTSYGKVYIDGKDFLLEDLDNSSLYVYIKDGRTNIFDPDFRVMDSYKILDYAQINEIISVLEHYEEEFPSRWNRSTNSLRSEWICHNILYYLNLFRSRTKDVDLNNFDELLFSSRILKRILNH